MPFTIATKCNLHICKLIRSDLEPRGVQQQNINKWYGRWFEYLEKLAMSLDVNT